MSTIHPEHCTMSGMEEALLRSGFGLYNKFIIGFAATCYLSNALAFMSVTLYLPIITCDIEIKEAHVFAIHVSLIIGMAFGGFFFSAVSDVVGRRSILALSLIMVFISILGGSFAYGPVNLMVANVFLGTGLATNLQVVKIYLAEINPMTHRGKYTIFLDLFWTIGCLIAISISIVFRPILDQYRAESARLFSWRLLYSFSSLLSIILSCITSLLLQSPRFLLYERRTGEALNSLREIFAINKSKVYSNYNLGEIDLQGLVQTYGINAERDIPNTLTSRRCMIILRRIHKAMLVLVRRSFFGYTLLVICMRIFTCFGLFMLNMLLAKTLLFQKECYFTSLNILHFEYPLEKDCSENTQDLDLYRDFAILALASMFGQFVHMYIVQYIEIKYLIGTGFLLAATMSMILAFIHNNYMVRFILSACMICGFAAADSCLNLLVIQIFPTAIRCTAFGETFVLARFALIFLIEYLDIACNWAFVSIGVMLGVAGLLSFAFPKFKGRSMAD